MWLLKLEAMAIAQCPRNRKTKCNKYTLKQNKKIYHFCKRKKYFVYFKKWGKGPNMHGHFWVRYPKENVLTVHWGWGLRWGCWKRKGPLATSSPGRKFWWMACSIDVAGLYRIHNLIIHQTKLLLIVLLLFIWTVWQLLSRIIWNEDGKKYMQIVHQKIKCIGYLGKYIDRIYDHFVGKM